MLACRHSKDLSLKCLRAHAKNMRMITPRKVFFFFTKWAHQQRTSMYERIVRDISLIFYEFRVALCDFCAFFTWIFENRVSKNINSFCNLRSGSIFVSLWKLHSGGQGETKREPDTKRLRNVFRPLFDWLTFAESDNQNYFRYLFFLVCKFSIHGKNAD